MIKPLKYLIFISILITLLLASSCKKENAVLADGVLTIDLSKEEFNSLQNINGTLYINELLIVKVGNQEFSVVSQNCPGDVGCITEYEKETFFCPCSGASYNQFGTIISSTSSTNRQDLRYYLSEVEDDRYLIVYVD